MQRISLRDVLNARWFLPLCFFVGLALRASTLMLSPISQTSDFLWYFERARDLASGKGYSQDGQPTAFWPVGWPGAMAMLFTVTGASALPVQVANIILGVASCLLTTSLGALLFGDRATGRLACFLLVICPNQIAYVPFLSTEIFYEMLLLSAIYLLAREQPLPALLAGALLGIATLTKAQTLILPGFVMLWVFLARPGWAALRRIGAQGFLVTVVMALVVAPWTYRNWSTFHEFIPVSTNGGWTLLTGNNPEANGGYTPDSVLTRDLSHDPAIEVTLDKVANSRARQWISAHPLQFLRLIPLKFMRLWIPDGEAEWFYEKGFASFNENVLAFSLVRVCNQLYYWLLLILAAPAMLRLMGAVRGQGSNWAHAGNAILVFFTLITIVYSGQSRFHFALMPFVAIYAASTITRVIKTGDCEPGGCGSSNAV